MSHYSKQVIKTHMRLYTMRTISASDNSEMIYLFLIYDYFELRKIWPPSLVISVSDYGTGALGSIPGWANILQCALFSFVLAFL